MKYLITGGSGYIGDRLARLLAEREETEAIVNLDIRPPASEDSPAEFVKGDIREREQMLSLLRDRGIDCLVHLAFVLNPIHDEGQMYDIDVNGTAAVLAAASEAGTGQVFVASSATAYGAWPDNPVPIAEDWPVRGMPDFSYPRHKAEVDRLCQLWAAEHPDRVMTIIRPCIVFGPNVDNYIVRAWTKAPYMVIVDGVESELQLIHEDDVVSAVVALLDAKAPGAFNVAGDGTIGYRESAELIGQKVRDMKLKTAYRLQKLFWRFHLPGIEAPAGAVKTIRYPWVVSNEKLKAAVGWQPKHTTRETFELTMRAKGKLPDAAPAGAGTEGAAAR